MGFNMQYATCFGWEFMSRLYRKYRIRLLSHQLLAGLVSICQDSQGSLGSVWGSFVGWKIRTRGTHVGPPQWRYDRICDNDLIKYWNGITWIEVERLQQNWILILLIPLLLWRMRPSKLPCYADDIWCRFPRLYMKQAMLVCNFLGRPVQGGCGYKDQHFTLRSKISKN